MKILPQMKRFLETYTDWDASRSPTALLEGMFPSCDTALSLRGVYSTEEWAQVPELGLK